MTPLRALVALVTGSAMARLAVVCVLTWLPYVRPQGLGVSAQGGRPRLDLAVAGATAALPLILDWRHGLLAAALVALSATALASFARARVGGATGDVYGAVVEVGQLAALVGFAVRI